MIVPLYLLLIFARHVVLYVHDNLARNMKRRVGSSSDNESNSSKNTANENTSNRRNQKRATTSKNKDVTDTVITVPPDYVEPPPSVSSVVIQSPVSKASLFYNMSLKHRGNCIIFNHKEFESGMGEPRLGTDSDVEAISRTFGALGFNIVVHPSLRFVHLHDEIEQLSKQDYTDHSCICVFVLTHGDSNGKLRARDASYPLTYLWKPFTADKCHTLGAKPKLFFIQACRGKMLDSGVPVCSRTETDSSSTAYKLPVHADFLIAHSTVDDHCSWRSPNEGSWYVQSLCSVIDTHWPTTDLLKMLTITSRTVATNYISDHEKPEKSNMVQMPSFTSTLTRDLYFAP